MSVPVGLSIASHSGLPPAGVGAVAQAAELAGFAAVFVAEGHGDALALCHPVAAATRQVRIGTAIANAALRPPVLAAKTAAQLDHACGGRFVLGLGVANAFMNAQFGRERTLAGDRAGAAGRVPQQVADGFVAHGGADDVLARAGEYLAAGVDLPVLFPMPVAGDWGYEKVIAALGGAGMGAPQ